MARRRRRGRGLDRNDGDRADREREGGWTGFWEGGKKGAGKKREKEGDTEEVARKGERERDRQTVIVIVRNEDIVLHAFEI